jgi:predicted metalloenzyme YecM
LDGVLYKSSIVIFGSSITAEPAPAKEGYTFNGWSEIPSTMPANDVEVSGSFSINSYMLTYKIDGEVYMTLTAEYGSSITAEPAPVKEGYTFSGWNDIPATMPASDVEVTGTFSINSYNLVYKIGDEPYKTTIVEYGSSIIAEPNPDKEGYTFSGWSEIPATMPANDVEVTGYYRINAYNLIYVIEGEVYKTITVEYGSSITPEPFPSKDGYTFSGWSEIPSVMPAGDLVVSGLFSVNYHELRYKIDGEIYKTDSVTYGSTIIAENAPAIVGYIFSGWDGIPVTMPDYDVEVTGSFVVNSYLLTVIVDGEVFYSDSVAYGTTLADYVEMLTDKGIDLSQWEYYGEIDTMVMPAHDVVINALLDAVRPIQTDANRLVVYDLNGKKLEVDDISALPTGIYIINGRKYVLQ